MASRQVSANSRRELQRQRQGAPRHFDINSDEAQVLWDQRLNQRASETRSISLSSLHSSPLPSPMNSAQASKMFTTTPNIENSVGKNQSQMDQGITTPLKENMIRARDTKVSSAVLGPNSTANSGPRPLLHKPLLMENEHKNGRIETTISSPAVKGGMYQSSHAPTPGGKFDAPPVQGQAQRRSSMVAPPNIIKQINSQLQAPQKKNSTHSTQQPGNSADGMSTATHEALEAKSKKAGEDERKIQNLSSPSTRVEKTHEIQSTAQSTVSRSSPTKRANDKPNSIQNGALESPKTSNPATPSQKPKANDKGDKIPSILVTPAPGLKGDKTGAEPAIRSAEWLWKEQAALVHTATKKLLEVRDLLEKLDLLRAESDKLKTQDKPWDSPLEKSDWRMVKPLTAAISQLDANLGAYQHNASVPMSTADTDRANSNGASSSGHRQCINKLQIDDSARDAKLSAGTSKKSFGAVQGISSTIGELVSLGSPQGGIWQLERDTSGTDYYWHTGTDKTVLEKPKLWSFAEERASHQPWRIRRARDRGWCYLNTETNEIQRMMPAGLRQALGAQGDQFRAHDTLTKHEAETT